jgi:hypothetical protein
MIATYIAVAWLTSCSAEGWVRQFDGDMTLEEAKGSLDVRLCNPLPPGTGWMGGWNEPHTFCVENSSKEMGYAAIWEGKNGPVVEMGPGVHPCVTPTS